MTETGVKKKGSRRWQMAWRTFSRNPLYVICLIILLAIIIFCFISPLIPSIDPISIDKESFAEGFSLEHPLGTDNLGRDMIARLAAGGKNTLEITFIAVLVSLIGFVLGLFLGYVGGKIDRIFSGIADLISAIPTFLLAIFFECALGFGVGNYRYAIGISLIPPLMRLSRNLAAEIKKQEFIEASRALGVSHFSIIITHVLPNMLPHVIVHVAGSLGEALLYCSMMGYLGVGINPPYPEWGNIIHMCYNNIRFNTGPSVAGCAVVFLTILCFNVVGNGIRDAVSSTGKEKA